MLIYVIWTRDLKMMLIRWVDDIVGWSSDGNSYIDRMITAMGKKFPIKLMGDIQ